MRVCKGPFLEERDTGACAHNAPGQRRAKEPDHAESLAKAVPIDPPSADAQWMGSSAEWRVAEVGQMKLAPMRGLSKGGGGAMTKDCTDTAQCHVYAMTEGDSGPAAST